MMPKRSLRLICEQVAKSQTRVGQLPQLGPDWRSGKTVLATVQKAQGHRVGPPADRQEPQSESHRQTVELIPWQFWRKYWVKPQPRPLTLSTCSFYSSPILCFTSSPSAFALTRNWNHPFQLMRQSAGQREENCLCGGLRHLLGPTQAVRVPRKVRSTSPLLQFCQPPGWLVYCLRH